MKRLSVLLRALLVSLSLVLGLLACSSDSQPGKELSGKEQSEKAPLQTSFNVNAEASRISFFSVKNNSMGETHHFEAISGTLVEGKQANLSIDLASVNTGIEIRDDRVKEFLFNVEQYPNATLHADLTNYDSASLEPGNIRSDVLPMKLSLYGIEQDFKVDVDVTRLADRALLVQSRTPVILDASRFNLLDGIAKLQELAGLNAISSAVPVSFSIRFE